MNWKQRICHLCETGMFFEGRTIWNLAWILTIFGIMLTASFLCYNMPYRDRTLFSQSVLGAFVYLIGAITYLPLGIIALILYNSTCAANIAFETLRTFLHEKAGIDYIGNVTNKNEEIIKSVWNRRRQVLLFIHGNEVTQAESNGVEFSDDCVIRVFDKDFEKKHLQALNKAIIGAAARAKSPGWPKQFN